ncbi:MAG: putative internalin [Fibrobacteres bacterium]|nr:putative internalin [Fibrobacterota bacterium]
MSVFYRILLLCACLLAIPKAESIGSSNLIPGEQGLPGVFETHSSLSMKAGEFVLGASGRFNEGTDLLKDGQATSPAGTRTLEDGFISNLRPFLAAGLGLGFDLALALPAYYEYLPGLGVEPETWGVGDFSGILKARIPFELPIVSFSVFASGSAPTSSPDGTALPKRLAYQPASGEFPDPVSHGDGLEYPRLGLGAGATFDLSDAMDGPRIAVHFNLSGDRTMADAALSPLGVINASVALEAFLAEGLRLESEFRHQRLVTDLGTLGSPLGRTTTIGIGLGWLAGNGFGLRLGGLIAPLAWNRYLPLNLEDGTSGKLGLAYRLQPTASGFLQVSWQGFPLGRDGDNDGVPDGRDRCPRVAEDKDGFQDEDGCPDPDNDGDGVADGADNCPYTAEDHDGFEDRDGCPELDNDHDGNLDSADRCPNDPEDRDRYLDEDGCPDLDDDQDGIPDAVDKCPRDPENRNGIEDEDGCPETDTDRDGLPDSRDKCPREREIVNFYQDEDGCPDEKPEPIGDAVLTGVEFQTGSSELLPGSFLILDGLAARMFAYPGTEIEVQGHIDDRGGAASKALTMARAEAVVEYLVNRGIESRRMKPVGYGASRPLGPNRTAQGRAANRRIQIRRLN